MLAKWTLESKQRRSRLHLDLRSSYKVIVFVICYKQESVKSDEVSE